MRDDRNESRNGVVNKAHRGKAGGDPISVDIYSSSEFLAAKFGPVWVELIQDSITFLTCKRAKNVAKKGFCSLWHQKNQPKNRTLQNTITWLSIMCGIKLGILKQKSKPIACNWHDCLAALVLCFSEVSSPSELLLISIPANVVSSLKNGGSV